MGVEQMYKIQLSNGQALDNLTLNGNNFISASKVEDTVFDGGLSSVTFTDTDTGKSQTYTDMVLIANRVFDGQSWFVLAEETPAEKEKRRLLARIAELEAAVNPEIPKKVATLEADVETLKTGYAAEFTALDTEYTKGVNSV